MLKKLLLNLAIVVVALNVLVAAYTFLWPFYDTSGFVDAGSYRGLNIGDSKAEIVRKTTNSANETKARIRGYLDADGSTNLVFRDGEANDIWSSNVWVLAYPSFHRETITLTFENDRLDKLQYHRDFFSP